MKILNLLLAVGALVIGPLTCARLAPENPLEKHGFYNGSSPLDNVMGLDASTADVTVEMSAVGQVPTVGNDELEYSIGTLSQECDPSQDGHSACLQRRKVLQKLQAISNEEFARYVCTGDKLVRAMAATKKDAEALLNPIDSPWSNYGDIDKWGWKADPMETMGWNSGFRVDELAEAFAHYRISDPTYTTSTGPGWRDKLYAWVHNTATEHDGEKYPATNAYYNNVINTREGVIIRKENRSPVAAAKDKTKPKLQHMSDVLYLSWRKELAVQQLPRAPLRFVVAYKFSNDKTKAIAIRGLIANGRQVPNNVLDERSCGYFQWANRVGWYTNTDIGKALLASPNGVAQSRLLIQHKDNFGDRTSINYIEFFCTGKAMWDYRYHLVYYVQTAG